MDDGRRRGEVRDTKLSLQPPTIEAFKMGRPRGTEAPEHVPGPMSGFEVRMPSTAQFTSDYEAGTSAVPYEVPCIGQHPIHLLG